jgi:hypothetical protein
MKTSSRVGFELVQLMINSRFDIFVSHKGDIFFGCRRCSCQRWGACGDQFLVPGLSEVLIFIRVNVCRCVSIRLYSFRSIKPVWDLSKFGCHKKKSSTNNKANVTPLFLHGSDYVTIYKVLLSYHISIRIPIPKMVYVSPPQNFWSRLVECSCVATNR